MHSFMRYGCVHVGDGLQTIQPFKYLHEKLEGYKANSQTGNWKQVIAFMSEKALWMLYK